MYHALITALYTQLGLPLPVAGQTATTLTINDELVLTLAEDEGHLVIYLLLPGHAMPNTPLLNHLGDEPVFLLDQTEQGETLIWAREWLDHLTVDSLLLLLERAIELAAELLTHQHDREQSTQPEQPASTTATIRV
ncbi:hypothetical protein LOS88_03935 [Aeromonas veronii]|uniref:hypothetical protein n=1 Tax=Aeromonas veronii TaxID=654 RepID=UPI001FD585EF|nr:hypothetical protein [Aeromonas veronii]MCJ7976821.1 hypothetical protein [Aeromonas veronii]UOR19841.1 hypothetical protein LOS88_03935 [Aeromonas veronii]